MTTQSSTGRVVSIKDHMCDYCNKSLPRHPIREDFGTFCDTDCRDAAEAWYYHTHIGDMPIDDPESHHFNHRHK